MLLVLAGSLWLASARPWQDEPRLLRPGTPVELELDPLAPESAPTFRVRVGPKATSLRLWTEDATHDVELFVNYGTPPAVLDGDYALEGPGTWMDEELLVDVTDGYNLEPGEWFVTVLAADTLRPPDGDGLVRCTLHADLVQPRPRALRVGEVEELELRWEEGLRSVHKVLLAEGAELPERLRVEVWSEDCDIDVLAGPPGAARVFDQPDGQGQSLYPYEVLELEGELLERGLVLHVYTTPAAEGWDDRSARVAVSDAAGPPLLCPEPALPSTPPADTPLERARAATVAVFGPLGGGSGVVVSPDGLVLTNAHVVVGAEGPGLPAGPMASVALGFNFDASDRVAPTVGCEIVGYDEDVDLALLRMSGNLLGEPLSELPALPYLEPAPLDELMLGDPVYGLGYPMTGGSGSLVSITLTRGVVSGWALEAEGRLLKTDADIHSGISGGACIDAQGRLLGAPSSSIGDANQAGGLGFVHTVEMVPEEWRALLGWSR